MFKARPPAHKPGEPNSKAMQKFHYSAIFASYLHCNHTCFRGFKHDDLHALHDELHTYPSKERTKQIMDLIHEDFIENIDNMPPHFRAAYCNAEDIAKKHLGFVQVYPFPGAK